ncbi:hypothetical protein B0H12DRAFT_1129477 [Mycena haematopus]|nr:hypothetical protein B0H12DRAFT_1129477 [Mycena haematopus]
MLIYTDGACASNGLTSPRAGFGFAFNLQKLWRCRAEGTGRPGICTYQQPRRASRRHRGAQVQGLVGRRLEARRDRDRFRVRERRSDG